MMTSGGGKDDTQRQDDVNDIVDKPSLSDKLQAEPSIGQSGSTNTGKNIPIHINTVVPTDPRVDVPCEVQGDDGPLHQRYQDDHPSSGGEDTRHHRVQSSNLTVLDPRIPPSLPSSPMTGRRTSTPVSSIMSVDKGGV